MRITVVGLGYVGMANAAMLSKDHNVIALDIDKERVQAVIEGRSTVADPEMEGWLRHQHLALWATSQPVLAYPGADLILVAVPTNYDEESGCFDTSVVEQVIEEACVLNPTAAIAIRSTVPVGFTQTMQEKHPERAVMFVPEFLREGNALNDTLNPSRIIIGANHTDPTALDLGRALSTYSACGFSIIGHAEAEAVKLFSNTYLAMRVAFFNELDSFAIAHDLNSEQIIRGVSADPRIGTGYNNPSFGYGGYCLPKDTKQLKANFDLVPENLISAIIESNETRKDTIMSEIISSVPILACQEPVIGIYRLTMKAGSDNWRESAVQGVMHRLINRGYKVVVYEPELAETDFAGAKVMENLDEFLTRSHLIVANRWDESLRDVVEKVYTRDIFQRD